MKICANSGPSNTGSSEASVRLGDKKGSPEYPDYEQSFIFDTPPTKPRQLALS